MNKKRNCVFLLIDCLRADKCWGSNRTAVTPNIDMMRNMGTTFTQAISTTTTTSPSVASILTGLYPFSHQVESLRGCRLSPGVSTLAQVFSNCGYHTYAEVTGPLVPQVGVQRGFHSYNCRRVRDNVYSSWYEDLIHRFAANCLEEPYFFFIHFFELHGSRLIADSFNKNEYGKNRYERALSSLDDRLGKLLEHIDDDTLVILHADHGERIAETMVAEYISKHMKRFQRKWEITFHRKPSTLYRVGHGFHVYEYLIRVPLIFRAKGLFPSDIQISDQVRQIDIFPTIVDALGLQYQNTNVHGRSLLPLIRGESLSEVPAYLEACGTSLSDRTKWLAGIRNTRYKYVFTPYAQNPSEELFDLSIDPNEKRNIVAKNPIVARKLREELEELRSKGKKRVNTEKRIRRLKIRKIV